MTEQNKTEGTPENIETNKEEAGSAPENSSSPPEEKRFTQAEIDRIVQERIARAKEAERQRADEKLRKLGIDGLDKVDEYAAEQQRKREEQLAKEGKYEELYAAERKRAEELEQTYKQRLEAIQQREVDSRIERELIAAASSSVNPQQVVALLKSRVRYDADTQSTYVVDEHGNRLTDGSGGYVTTTKLVQDFLSQNPHFAPAAGGRGAGQPGTGRVTDQAAGDGAGSLNNIDKTKLEDPEYRAKVYARLRSELQS